MRVGKNGDLHTKLGFKVCQFFTVLVEQFQRRIGRGIHLDPIQSFALKQQITNPTHDGRGQ